MTPIISTIIAGLFSLAGIWYQNYLRTRPFNTTLAPKTVSPTRQTGYFRLTFTILIGILPWLIWGFTLRSINTTVHKHLHTYAKIMSYYLLLWIIITFVALFSGWKLKMLIEKIILLGSLLLLIYWELWMIIVHDLLHFKSLS